jgi:hypothetical protein
MKKNSIFQLFKGFNISIKLIIALLVLIIGILIFYNNKILENMTINIYTDKDYKVNENDSSNVKPYDKTNNYNDDSNDSKQSNTPLPPPPAPKTTEPPPAAPKTTEPAPAPAPAPAAKSDAKSVGENAAARTSGYIKAFTDPIKPS